MLFVNTIKNCSVNLTNLKMKFRFGQDMWDVPLTPGASIRMFTEDIEVVLSKWINNRKSVALPLENLNSLEIGTV